LIIGISGKKQSGKNTTANVLHGIVLKERGLVKDFNICDEGKLRVLTDDASGQEGWGEWDITRRDPAFVEYAEHNMWPYVKLYSFADALKSVCVELFNIPPECVYGTDEQKNTLIPHLLWENMPGVTTEVTPQDPVDREVAGRLGVYYEKVLSGVVYHKPGPMTSREILQFFGTDIMRKMWEPVWVSKCLKDIKREGSLLAIIADIRFPNEVAAVEEAGGFVCRLTRQVFEDAHASEVALDDHQFKYIIENEELRLDILTDKITGFHKQLQNPFIRNANVSYIC
jgi:hypothetical protein